MNQTITVKFNAWIICAILLVTNLVTIGLWHPWTNSSASDRTIAITGTTSLEAEPDQFVFNPYYQEQGTNRADIDAKLSKLSKTIVAKLKSLGVADSAIKIDASSYDYGIYRKDREKTLTATLSLTVNLKNKALAQKIQDYLATTSPSGSITPQNTFSVAKQKELESKARQEALKDAKSKAETTAEQLGVKLGKVISVGDITSGSIMPLPWALDYSTGKTEPSSAEGSGAFSYTIQPGLNQYTCRVVVTYELK